MTTKNPIDFILFLLLFVPKRRTHCMVRAAGNQQPTNKQPKWERANVWNERRRIRWKKIEEGKSIKRKSLKTRAQANFVVVSKMKKENENGRAKKKFRKRNSNGNSCNKPLAVCVCICVRTTRSSHTTLSNQLRTRRFFFLSANRSSSLTWRTLMSFALVHVCMCVCVYRFSASLALSIAVNSKKNALK